MQVLRNYYHPRSTPYDKRCDIYSLVCPSVGVYVPLRLLRSCSQFAPVIGTRTSLCPVFDCLCPSLTTVDVSVRPGNPALGDLFVFLPLWQHRQKPDAGALMLDTASPLLLLPTALNQTLPEFPTTSTSSQSVPSAYLPRSLQLKGLCSVAPVTSWSAS